MGGEVGAQRELEYQQAVVEALADAASVREGTPALLESLCRRVGWRAGELWIVDPRTNVLGRSGSWPAARAAWARRARGTRALTGADGAAIARSVWSSGEAEWAIDRSPRRPRSTPWRSVFAFPVLTGSRAVGALVLLDPRLKARDDAFARRMARLGLHIGAWIQCKGVEEALRAREEEYRQLSGRLLRLQDEERRRIARELHDSTGQCLASIRMHLETAQRAAPELPENARKALQEAVSTCQTCTADIRTISYLLHPPLLDEVGLLPALDWYVSGFSERSGIKVTQEVAEPDTPLSKDLNTALFRIIQEALANIHKHAESKQAKVRLFCENNTLVLEISDCGKGFDPSQVEGRREGVRGLGVGITGMRERVRQLHGTLEIAAANPGTLVRATFPIREEHNGDA